MKKEFTAALVIDRRSHVPEEFIRERIARAIADGLKPFVEISRKDGVNDRTTIYRGSIVVELPELHCPYCRAVISTKCNHCPNCGHVLDY